MGKFNGLRILALLILISGCGSESGFTPGAQVPAFARVLNLLPDSNRIFYSVDRGTYEGSLSFNESTGFLRQISQADLSIRLYYFDENDQEIDLYTSSNFRLQDNEYGTIIITGTLASPEVDITARGAPVSTNDAPVSQLRYYHGASYYNGAVDFYLEQSPGAETIPAATLLPGEASALNDIDISDVISYHIRVTPAGSNTVLWESGLFTLGAGVSQLVILTDHAGPANQNVRGLRADGSGIQLFIAEALPAAVRIVNLLAETTNVNLELIDTAISETGLTLGYIGSYQTLPPQAYSILVTDADSGETLNDTSFNVVSGQYQTITLGGVPTDTVVRIESNVSRTIPDFARLSLVYAGNLTSSADIYLLEAGENLADVNPDIAGVFLLAEGLGTLPAGDIDVVVTARGEKTALLGPRTLSLEAGKNYSFYISDSPGGVAPLLDFFIEDF